MHNKRESTRIIIPFLMSSDECVVGFIDMDCFCEFVANFDLITAHKPPFRPDVAVEANGPFSSEVKGKAAAVVQYNPQVRYTVHSAAIIFPSLHLHRSQEESTIAPLTIDEGFTSKEAL